MSTWRKQPHDKVSWYFTLRESSTYSVPRAHFIRQRAPSSRAIAVSLLNVRPALSISRLKADQSNTACCKSSRLSFRLGDQYVLCPRVSLSAPPLSVQSLADRPSWLPK